MKLNENISDATSTGSFSYIIFIRSDDLGQYVGRRGQDRRLERRHGYARQRHDVDVASKLRLRQFKVTQTCTVKKYSVVSNFSNTSQEPLKCVIRRGENRYVASCLQAVIGYM
jgi:hypothetical protein